jgi:(p)ppGpp synthase/HD superfamily hydrolase
MTRSFRKNQSDGLARPLAVVRILHDAGVRDGTIVLGAMLHDALMDVDSIEEMHIRLQAIRRVCGPSVATMVRSLTRNAVQQSVPPHEGERRYLARMRFHAVEHPGIVIIALACMLHDVRRTRHDEKLVAACVAGMPFFRTMRLHLPQHLCVPYTRLLEQCSHILATGEMNR